jgi:hypothetical protein
MWALLRPLVLVTLTTGLFVGCGSGSHTIPAATPANQCKLSAAQRREIRRARREIARLHRLETFHKWREHGPPAMEEALNRFLLGVGVLPVFWRGLLIDKAKSATGLCGDCFQALEALQPAPVTRVGGSVCAPGV